MKNFVVTYIRNGMELYQQSFFHDTDSEHPEFKRLFAWLEQNGWEYELQEVSDKQAEKIQKYLQKREVVVCA